MNFSRTKLHSLHAALALLLPFAGCAPDAATPDALETSREVDHGGEHREGMVSLSSGKLQEITLITAGVQRRTLDPELETTGQVDYEQDRLAHVSPRINGRVLRVSAALGDDVGAGESLAIIDSVELGQAKAEYLGARVREELARENAAREARLFADRISSEKEMLEARAAHLEARSHRESAEETLRLFGVGRAEIDALSAGDPGASHLAVRAPIAGRVVEKHVTVGELVTPTDNMFSIADLGHVWIWIDVFERDLASVHLGDGVEVRAESYPDRLFEGKVTYLSPEVTAATRTVRARIDVPNPEEVLRPGMFATVRLTDPHREGGEPVLAVPSDAVQRRGETSLVFVPLDEEGSFEAREVSIGRRQGNWTEITAGLSEGESVVTKGAFFLKSELARDELGAGHDH